MFFVAFKLSDNKLDCKVSYFVAKKDEAISLICNTGGQLVNINQYFIK